MTLTQEFPGTQTGRHKQSPISLHKLCQGNGTCKRNPIICPQNRSRAGDGKAAFLMSPINIYLNTGMEKLYFRRLMAAEFSRIIDSC